MAASPDALRLQIEATYVIDVLSTERIEVIGTNAEAVLVQLEEPHRS